MRLQEGKFYRTRDGRKVGPMRSDDSFREPALIEVDWDGRGWSTTGRAIGVNHSREEDLVAEWTDGPVRTVTRREVVPGVYGLVSVCEGPHPEGKILVHMDRSSRGADAGELRAAAAVLLELAGALDE